MRLLKRFVISLLILRLGSAWAQGAPTNLGGSADARLLWATQVPGYPSADQYELVEFPAQQAISFAGKVYFSVPAAAAAGTVHLRVKAAGSQSPGASAASTIAYTAPPAGMTDILLVGDSNTYGGPGTQTQPGQCFAALATRLLAGRYNVYNLGVGGTTTTTETDIFQAYLPQYTRPPGRRVLTMVMLGTNNPASSVSLAQAKRDIKRYHDLLAPNDGAGIVCSALEPVFNQSGPTHQAFFVNWASYLSTKYDSLGFTEYVPVWENTHLGYAVADYQAANFGMPSNQANFELWNCNNNYAVSGSSPGSACQVYQPGGPDNAGGADFYHWGNRGHAEALLTMFLPAFERTNVALAIRQNIQLAVTATTIGEDYVIYPNPTTTGSVTLSGNRSVTVRDMLGQVVHAQLHGKQLQLPGPGVYVVEWADASGQVQRRKVVAQ